MWRRFRLPITIIFISILLILLLPKSINQTLKSGANHLLKPLLSVSYSTSSWLNTRISNIRSLGSIYDERATLQEKVIELQQQVVALSSAAQENESLRAELNISNRPPAEDTVAATIINRSINNLIGEALIDQGANAGIQEGQAVMSQGVLVGKISQVFSTTSIVTLVNAPNASIQAMLTDSQALGLVYGRANSLLLTEIDQGVTIKEGEIVQTSGLGGTIPKGLIIGEVDHVTSQSGQSKQEAVLRTPINFDHLRLVFVILRQPPNV